MEKYTLRAYANLAVDAHDEDSEYKSRDKELRDAEIAFYEACDIPLDVEMPRHGLDYSDPVKLEPVEWQLVQEEESLTICHNGLPYATLGWSCRGRAYMVDGYCAQGDRYFVGTDNTKFGEVYGEVRFKNIHKYREQFAELVKH